MCLYVCTRQPRARDDEEDDDDDVLRRPANPWPGLRRDATLFRVLSKDLARRCGGGWFLFGRNFPGEAHGAKKDLRARSFFVHVSECVQDVSTVLVCVCSTWDDGGGVGVVKQRKPRACM